jgi:hypothetical protein
VNLTQLTHPALARHDPRLVRWELFVFSDVRDVLPTSRRETVVVAHRGPAREVDWIAALDAAGMLDEQPVPPTAA